MRWIYANKLSLNISKTHYMIFKTRGKTVKTNFNVDVDQVKLQKCRINTVLGVIIDEKLSWLHHITYIKSKTYWYFV